MKQPRLLWPKDAAKNLESIEDARVVWLDDKDRNAINLGADALRRLDELEKWAEAKKSKLELLYGVGSCAQLMLIEELLKALHGEMEMPAVGAAVAFTYTPMFRWMICLVKMSALTCTSPMTPASICMPTPSAT